jgi:hypothetical protein
MFNPQFIFITLTLVILVGVAYRNKVPQVIIPLGIVYLLFLFLNDPSPKSLPSLQPIKNSTLGSEQKISTKFETNSQPIETTISPTPLTFDSGRTTKRIENQSPTDL